MHLQVYAVASFRLLARLPLRPEVYAWDRDSQALLVLHKAAPFDNLACIRMRISSQEVLSRNEMGCNSGKFSAFGLNIICQPPAAPPENTSSHMLVKRSDTGHILMHIVMRDLTMCMWHASDDDRFAAVLLDETMLHVYSASAGLPLTSHSLQGCNDIKCMFAWPASGPVLNGTKKATGKQSLLNMHTKSAFIDFTTGGHRVQSNLYSPDGHWIAVSSTLGTCAHVKVYDSYTGQVSFCMAKDDNSPRGEVDSLYAARWTMTFSPNGKFLFLSLLRPHNFWHPPGNSRQRTAPPFVSEGFYAVSTTTWKCSPATCSHAHPLMSKGPVLCLPDGCSILWPNGRVNTQFAAEYSLVTFGE